jgi:acyl-coenzyme A thioesterase PaaI-like protein
MRDRRFHRNHLKSLHAIALANLAECASGLSLVPGLPAKGQAILTHFEIDYLKKARGTIEATASCSPPVSVETQNLVVESKLFNNKMELVAQSRATWRIGAKKT